MALALILMKRDIPYLLDILLQNFKVYGPTVKEGEFTFSQISSAKELSLKYDTTILPPKKILQPYAQTLFYFRKEKNNSFNVINPRFDEKQLILGIHPCDVNAILLLDRVFGGEYRDLLYIKRRENTVIIALNCTEVWENCFCGSLNSGPFLKGGYDLLLTDLGDQYLVEAGSDIGGEIIGSIKLRKATSKDLKRKKERFEAAKANFRKFVDTSDLPGMLRRAYEKNRWLELGEECFNCGNCTLVCPTCYCFRVYDEIDFDLKNGIRKSEWDSCLLLEFAEVAGGNFRVRREERFKQRIYHKFDYCLDQYGLTFYCTGCGRCVKYCPKKILRKGKMTSLADPTEIIKEIRE